MNVHHKEITYNSTNSYAILNDLNDKTKNVWLVFHGMGYLSRYFLKYFKSLDAQKNYILAPQAPSKYYIPPKMHVGANWLTRVNTLTDTANVLNYIDAVLEAEMVFKSITNYNLIVLGYSQGVSIAMRYLASRKLQCEQLVIHSGGIPEELTPKDFNFMLSKTTVKLIYGKDDEYLNEERMLIEQNRAKRLFGNRLNIMPFEGAHVINQEAIENIGREY